MREARIGSPVRQKTFLTGAVVRMAVSIARHLNVRGHGLPSPYEASMLVMRECKVKSQDVQAQG